MAEVGTLLLFIRRMVEVDGIKGRILAVRLDAQIHKRV